MLELREINKSFQTPEGDIEAVKNVSLEWSQVRYMA